jgi:TusA-related sulfurtransferase
MKVQKKIKAIKEGEKVILVTDHSCSVVAVKDFCKTHHFECQPIEVMRSVWEIEITCTITTLEY